MKTRFRVFDGTAKEMWYPGQNVSHEWYINGNGFLVKLQYKQLSDTFIHLSYEGCVPMLSTGDKDKNGKEIFDGDIVRWAVVDMDKPELWLVTWDKGSPPYSPDGWRLHRFCDKQYPFIHLSLACAGWMFKGNEWMPEIVGNKFENHELMEE